MPFSDSGVYRARNTVPWARIDVGGLLQDLTQHDEEEVRLTVRHRPSVLSRMWWTIHWTSENGLEYGVSAQTLQLCAWRAAVREQINRKTMTEAFRRR